MLFGPAVCLSVCRSASLLLASILSILFRFHFHFIALTTTWQHTHIPQGRSGGGMWPGLDCLKTARGLEKTTRLTFCWNFNKPLSNHRHQGLCFIWPSAAFVSLLVPPSPFSRTGSASLYALPGEYWGIPHIWERGKLQLILLFSMKLSNTCSFIRWVSNCK